MVPVSGADGEKPIPEFVRAEVVHAIAGRLRLRIQRLRWDAAYPSQLEPQIKSLDGVTGVQINPAAASVTITYTASQFAAQVIPPLELLAALEQVSGIQIDAGEKAETPAQPTAMPESTDPLKFDSQVVQTQLKSVGGGLIGGAAGDMVGGAVGATAGAIVLGPPGVILGSQLGVFVGSVIGTQIGAETIHQVEQMIQLSNSQTNGLTPQKIAEILQKRAGEKMGETTGQVVGGVVGKVVMGMPGQMVGSIVGGVFGGQIGEDAASQSPATSVQPMPQPSSNNPLAAPQWLAKTTQNFVGETASATVGGALGKIVLGPAGQQIGFNLGTRIAKITNAHSNLPPQPEDRQEGEQRSP
jgi:hypothetical protein